MEGRERVGRFLGGRATDRPPFLPFVAALAARLEQVPPERLAGDVNALTRALTAIQELFGLDAVVVDVNADAVEVAAEALKRLRVLLGDRAGVVVALPGPLGGGSGMGAEKLDDLAAGLVAISSTLGLEHADCLAVVERQPVTGNAVAALDDALTPLWNVARHYAIPSLLVLAEADVVAADTGADAVAVWSGVSWDELAARGARRVGVPVALGHEPPSLPDGGFYTTAGELDAAADVDAVHTLVATVTGTG